MKTAPPLRCLIVEDDRSMRQSFVSLLEADGWRAQEVSRAERVEAALQDFPADVILSDVRMPGMSGMELVDMMRGTSAPPIVLISAHGDIAMAVEAMQAGAYSFVEKPHDPNRLLNILRHAAEQTRMRADNDRLRTRLLELSGLDRVLLGQTDSIRALRRDILSIADTPSPVMILGETGTGKDLVARGLHDLGPLSDRPFVAVNCALLSADRFGIEMFGEAGGPEGYILQANGGTLFLDEIASCPPEVQASFLRVLEDQELRLEGSTEPVPVQVRVISSTNEDIQMAVDDGRFRADLLYRLNTFTLRLPPLRNRLDDLSILMSHFMDEYAALYEVDPPELTPSDFAALMAHEWPGNVRELRSVAERRLLSARRGIGSVAEAIAPSQPHEDTPETLRSAVAAFERDLISRAIRANGGKMDLVAEVLGIGRRTLNEKMVKLNLNKDDLTRA